MTHKLLGSGTRWMVVPLIRRRNAGGKALWWGKEQVK